MTESMKTTNLPPIVSAEEWAVAREKLLVKEKAATRARDALAAERRRIEALSTIPAPVVRIRLEELL